MTIIPSSQKKSDKGKEPERVPAVDQAKATANGQAAWQGASGMQVAKRSTVLSAKENTSDASVEVKLRPQRMEQYIGQTRLKSMLKMSIAAAKSRSEALDHVLFYGPPGLGKTTLARVIANEMGAKIYVTSGPTLERPRDIIGLLHQLQVHDVLFIDEIHRLSKVAEELLYPAIEDFVVDLTSGKGQATRTMRLGLPRFTLIGATTKAGLITNALRDRFGFVCRLDFYSEEELTDIVARTASIFSLQLEVGAAAVIAARARGTPRIANRLVRLVRDYGQYIGKTSIDAAVATAALEAYQVDASGLDATDRRLLEILIDRYNGGPVGIETLAATLGEDSDTLEEVYEPFLMQNGFIQRTPRGRIATAIAYAHLGRKPENGQLGLDLNDKASSES
jgi:holliday junction DNA helicase RuvB